jgi:hypothetical protein
MRGRIRVWAFFMADLSQEIEDAAKGPARASSDGTSVDQRPIAELIEADRYNKGNTAAAKNHFGLRFSKLNPGGCG